MSIETKLIESFSDLLAQIPPDSESFNVTKQLLEQFQQCFQTLREANPDELKDLTLQWETEPNLFNEIGKIVRSFYDQMKTIRTDIPERLGELANYDMKDASKRLQHIVEMTENAANKTMDLSEEILENMSSKTEAYEVASKRIEATLELPNLPPEVIETLKETQTLIQQNQEDRVRYQGQLTDILIAQDYQDLTGQVIQKIVDLLGHLEQELMVLIQTFGQTNVQKGTASEKELKGPQKEGAGEKQSQDDADALLASLGF